MSECNHVKADGNTCKSPSLKNQKFCYFHLATRDRVRRQRLAAQRKLPLQLPVLEDAGTIQLAIGDTVNAMLAGRIDYKHAALTLYALQTAATNVERCHFANEYNSFKEYSPELDPGLPAIEEIPATPADDEKKPPQPAPGEGEVIPKIQASAERRLPPKKSAARDVSSAANKSLIQSAIKHLKKRSRA